jgi:curli production assembly/transport component CsgF
MRATAFAAVLSATLSAGASAQEFVYQPINPNFGGNPFNADLLLSVASAQRPERQRNDGGQRLSEGEQFARQIQSRLLSSLASGVVEAITGADPGTSGEFLVGDQRIAFERTLTEIRLTITDEVTGEVTEIVVPVLSSLVSDGSSQIGVPRVQGFGTLGTLGSTGLTGGGLGTSPLTEGPVIPQGPLLSGGAPIQ